MNDCFLELSNLFKEWNGKCGVVCNAIQQRVVLRFPQELHRVCRALSQLKQDSKMIYWTYIRILRNVLGYQDCSYQEKPRPTKNF